MTEKIEFPQEINKLTDEEDLIVKKYYKNYVRPFVRVGPHGYFSPPGYSDHAADIYNLEVRSDDIWVMAFSRSGTTWLQELTWLLANGLDYKEAATTPLSKRYTFIEYPTLESDIKSPYAKNYSHRATEDDFTNFHTLPSPRFVKTHLPLSLLPPNLLDTAKVLYVARDPRDVAVSFHFMHKLFRYFDHNVEFDAFWDLFKKDLVLHTPIFPHIEESWDKRHHPNMMFLFYEEMQKDLRQVIDQVCKFLGKEYTEEQKNQLVQHLKFENMKKIDNSKFTKSGEKDSELEFMRKGKSGNWIKYFDSEDMKKEADEYMLRHLKQTDLRFPKLE